MSLNVLSLPGTENKALKRDLTTSALFITPAVKFSILVNGFLVIGSIKEFSIWKVWISVASARLLLKVLKSSSETSSLIPVVKFLYCVSVFLKASSLFKSSPKELPKIGPKICFTYSIIPLGLIESMMVLTPSLNLFWSIDSNSQVPISYNENFLV